MRNIPMLLIAAATLTLAATPIAAEGTGGFVFMGLSVSKTVEFSYYYDVCGDQATGERLRRLAARRLDACELPTAEKSALRNKTTALSADMRGRIRNCDADQSCVLGKRQFCPNINEHRSVIEQDLIAAEGGGAALERVAGACE
ncbi:MAG TPA: hypothetical protein VEU47_14635 [Candidatus Cybelea sp.]|nr:hypothetical protein [Candidatus Cybelea sp.]